MKSLGKGCFGRFGTHYEYFHYFLWGKKIVLTYDQLELRPIKLRIPTYFPSTGGTNRKNDQRHHSVHGTGEEHDVMFLAQPSATCIRSQFVLQLHSSVRS
jgi:hypothetical protein